jgi:nucleoid-associated protein YgaU
MELAKLTITALKENMKDATASPNPDSGLEVVCQFNPESFSFTKKNFWTKKKDIGSSQPELIFSGGDAATLSLSLLFDTTDTGKSVRDKYKKLDEMIYVPADKKEPRHVQIQWGELVPQKTFIATIESMSEQYLMFNEDGTPLRAKVELCLKQAWNADHKAPMNPTSRSDARRTWVVEQGQRLDWIAHQVYGNSSSWRQIADTNQISNPALIRPGQILKIPTIE